VARIALVHDIAGVAEVQAELLRSAGHEVDHIMLPATGASWNWPMKGLALPLRVAAFVPTALRLRSGKYDVIHVHWLPNGIVGVMAGRSFFAQAHGSDLHLNFNNPVYRWVTRRVLEKARAIFYVTPNLRAYLKEFEGKLLYLPNPVDMRGIGQQTPAPSKIGKVLIFTRLAPVKGIEHIFPAAERLSRMAEVSALEYGPLAKEYLRKYGRWVQFARPIPHAEVGDFLHQFDVVIGQMRQGILSLMEIEALAAGRPLITAIDWDLYRDDPPPVVAASGADAIVAAVERLKNDPQTLERLSREGREWVLRNHSYAHHLHLLDAAYFGSASREPALGAGV
jgi:glycosyltransferase involved in cell wall biosynthesis